MGDATFEVKVIPESFSLKAGRVMGISFLVTYGETPIEGAFVIVNTSSGSLSQSGASTFPDGTQRIKYTAPEVTENTTITIQVRATKFGYPEVHSSAEFVVEPATSYEKVSTSTSFSFERYWVYIVIIAVLFLINIIIILYNIKKKRKNTESGKDEQMGSGS
jgi:hypothetical protein